MYLVCYKCSGQIRGKKYSRDDTGIICYKCSGIEKELEINDKPATFNQLIKLKQTTSFAKTFGSGRANHQSAKIRTTIGDVVAERGVGAARTIKGKLKWLITDMCDFCFKHIQVKRSFMRMRVRGYKFACRNCWDEKGFEFGKCKVFIENRNF